MSFFRKLFGRRRRTGGEQSQAGALLWRGLEADPNQEDRFNRCVSMARQEQGEEGMWQEIRRISAIPGSWRAQLWLAQARLLERDLAGAMQYYGGVLSLLDPVPTDVLMQISGDLGNAGHLLELMQITAPRFAPELHGVAVGHNLIKAYVDLGQIDAAGAVVEQLYAVQCDAWKQQLRFWEGEIAKLRAATEAAQAPGRIEVGMVVLDGPVWLNPHSPAAELFPAKNGPTVRIALLGGSAERPSSAPADRAVLQLSDASGRLSRSIPLFLAEQLEFRSNAQVQTLIPWTSAQMGGFVVASTPLGDDDVVALALRGNDEGKGKSKEQPDYAVRVHLKKAEGAGAAWMVQARILRTSDGRCVATVEGGFSENEPEEGINKVVDDALAALAREGGLAVRSSVDRYAVPRGKRFALYLLRLEQLLTVRCAAHAGERFLHGEREILEGNLQLCLAEPGQIPVRLLMAQTFCSMKKVSPHPLPEFKQKIEMLQRDYPLPAPVHHVLRQMLDPTLFNVVLGGPL